MSLPRCDECGDWLTWSEIERGCEICDTCASNFDAYEEDDNYDEVYGGGDDDELPYPGWIP